MKGTLLWLRDKVFPGVIVAIVALWLASLSFEGLISTALQSWEGFFQWMKDPVEISRWKLLFMLLVAISYGVMSLRAFLISQRIVQAERAARKSTLSVELVKLDENQVFVLEYLAKCYAVNNPHTSSRDISSAAKTSLLRTDQLLDQLLGLDFIKFHLVMTKGKYYSLSPLGREWLLANGRD